jgi:hypothetical protein
MSDPTASMLAKVAPGRPLINDLLLECRSGHSSFDTLTDGGTCMKYMLLISIDEQVLSEAKREECYAESVQVTHQLKSRGQYLAANPLHPTAACVRMRDGKVLVTDGPFAETREQLGG